jgi:hypothetical protein
MDLRVVIDLDELQHDAEKGRLLDALSLELEHQLELAATDVPQTLLDALAVVSLSEPELYGALCDLADARAAGLDERAATIALPYSERNARALHVQLNKRLPLAARAARATAAVRRHDFMRPPTAESAADPQATELDAFVRAHFGVAAEAKVLELRVFADTGRGLATTRALADGDVALSVPRAVVLTAAGLREASRGGPAEGALEAVDDETALALALLAACAQPGSAWAAYEPLLPTAAAMPHCSCWLPAELAALAGTAVAGEALAAVEALRATFDAGLAALAGRLFVGGEALTFARFQWAAGCVATRALLVDFKNGAGKVGALVPVADMLNHHVRAPLASAAYCPVSESVRFVASAPVAAGAQLRLFYGPLPGAELLLQYGFLDTDALAEGATAEAVRFDVEPPDGDDDADALRKALLFACGRYTASHLVTAARPVTSRLLGALRLCLLDSDGMAALATTPERNLEAGPFDPDNEALVWSALAQLLRQMRDALPGGSAADDAALLGVEAGGGGDPLAQSYTLATIVRWRMHQKLALDAAIAITERHHDNIDDGDETTVTTIDGLG